MMKKSLLFMGFFVLLGFFVFGNTQEQEVAFLLFAPDSSDTFADEEQAKLHLEKAAQFLRDKAIYPGQIHVYGFSANFVNEINPTNLSRDRAAFVINELQKRGVPQELFADPVGVGAVDSWDINENDISLNRRVIIAVDDIILTPVEVKIVEPEVIIASADEETESGRGFPWWLLLLLLLLLAAILFLLSKLKKKPEEKPVAAVVPKKAVPPVVISKPVISKTIVCLEEEIRFCAYMLHFENGPNSDMDSNWRQAVSIICPQYESNGHEVYMEEGRWWARR